MYFYNLLLFFGSTGVWTQGLTFARQVFLPLEPIHQPIFALGVFEIWPGELFAWGWL
jgi:hypothetical protein